MQPYRKPYLPVADQVALLEQRGLIITDRPKAEHYLSTIGYYRLSGYSYSFRRGELKTDGELQVLDQFKAGVRFDDILALYVFDKRLRLALLDAIERIEVALRVGVALELGKHSAGAHLEPRFMYDSFSQLGYGRSTSQFQDWQQKFQKTFGESREDFVVHFKAKYPQSDLPIWMATELWDFGMLSKYFANLKDEYKMPIAGRYSLQTVKLLVSWLHTINVVRNICAHHGRLWNRVMVKTPKYPKAKEAVLLRPMVENKVPDNRIFAAMCIIQYFMHHVSPNSSWNNRVVDLVSHFPESPYINTTMMGIPDGWQYWQLWE